MDRGIVERIHLCVAPVDMRKGFDALAAMVREFLGQDPLSGNLFLFVGRGKDRLKILYWDRDGFALWYKRLEEGTFRVPRITPDAVAAGGVELKASELAMMLDGIDLKSVKRTKRLTLNRKAS
jgi:transposase